MTTGILGADYAAGRWVVGLSLAHSEGDGTWYSASRGGGGISSSLTGLYPYAGYDVAERLSLWGVAGYGEGNLTMAAIGIRGDLLFARQASGLALAFESSLLVSHGTAVPNAYLF